VKSRKSKQLISTIILLLIVTAIGLYLRANWELLSSLSNISLASTFWLIVTRLLFIGTSGLFLQASLAKFEVQLSLKEWFGLAIVTTLGNYLTPFSGGMVARATYLKYRYTFPYSQFVAVLIANYLVSFWVVGVIGLGALLLFVETTQFYWQVMLFFLVVIVAISLLTCLPTIKLPDKSRWIRLLNNSLEGWYIVKNDKPLLAKLIVYTLINILLNGVSFWVAYEALGLSVSFAAALLIGLLTVFSIFLNITPGNLGVQEGVIGLSSVFLGAGMGQGLLVAFLIRAATIIVAFTLGPIFSFLLAQELPHHQLNGPESVARDKTIP
jgi:uncharacterized membrane protein YbhN (UPF0104 family)